jgi:hypothetical protein
MEEDGFDRSRHELLTIVRSAKDYARARARRVGNLLVAEFPSGVYVESASDTGSSVDQAHWHDATERLDEDRDVDDVQASREPHEPTAREIRG